MAEEATESNLIRRILEGISGGYYPNAYSLYGKLPKAFRDKLSYWDILKTFHELEWNVKVIEINEVIETEAHDPWKPGIGITPGIVMKKVVSYRIRPEFAAWNYTPELFDTILKNLHQDSPTIEFSRVPLS